MKSDKARELLEEFRSVTTRRGNLLDTVRLLAVREVVNVLLWLACDDCAAHGELSVWHMMAPLSSGAQRGGVQGWRRTSLAGAAAWVLSHYGWSLVPFIWQGTGIETTMSLVLAQPVLASFSTCGGHHKTATRAHH